jgi:4-hydroxybenzoate polyprenyltransferase
MTTSDFMPVAREPLSTGKMPFADAVTSASSANPFSSDSPAELLEASVVCTDLDGTLLRTDSLWESLLLLIKARPASCLLIPIWLFRGKASFKAEIARRISPNPATLPYRDDVLDFLRKQKESGREIILATGSNRRIAESISDYLALFSAVLASDEKVNLVGQSKLLALREFLGDKEFDYIGNGAADLAVWRAARKSLVVTSSRHLLKKVQQVNTVDRVFPSTRDYIRIMPAALRIHHWTKNLLLFVPLLLAHKIFDAHRLLLTILVFFSFSFLASGGYVINDCFDLEADRIHAVKRYRPIAYGSFPIWLALAVASALVVGSLAVAWSVFDAECALVLTLYFVCSILYTHFLKHIPVLDVLILAGLYTLRVLAGGVSAHVPLSPWFLGFSMFFFLSLAFAKRFSEMFANVPEKELLRNRRGYRASDCNLFRSVGPTSGYISALIFALYISGSEVTALYRHPQYLWLIGPILLYWITRVWLLAERGEMHSDPVVFAIRDKTSYVLGILVVVILCASL